MVVPQYETGLVRGKGVGVGGAEVALQGGGDDEEGGEAVGGEGGAFVPGVRGHFFQLLVLRSGG